jgi:hypothetical protein
MQAKEGAGGLPWALYLLFSVFTAIAATGSIFEFNEKNPLFGVLPPDNPLWAPILLFFAVTGFPMSGGLAAGAPPSRASPEVGRPALACK